jgi:acetyl esterase/lipase
MKMRSCIAVILAAFALQAEAPQTNPLKLLADPTPPVDTTLTYGTDPAQFEELRLPPGDGPFPVAIVVHGGCWSVTVPHVPPTLTTLALMRPLAAALTADGYATFNVEYRRLGNGGGWPATYADLSTATDLVRTLAPVYHLDLGHVITIGHSSGGQLAEWIGSRAKIAKGSDLYVNNPVPIAGIVDLDGPPDLDVSPDLATGICGSPVTEAFAGGKPAQVPTHYHDGSAAGLMPIGVRQEVFSTGAFGKQWLDLFTTYAARAKKAGDTVDLHETDSAGHFDVIDPHSALWPAVLAAVNSFK